MNIVALDVETTGTKPELDRIIEIGAYKPSGEVFSCFVNPCCPLPGRITELTGITEEMLIGALEEKEAIEALFSFLGEEAVLLGHNILFDYSFLWAGTLRLGYKDIPVKLGIDTWRIAKKTCAALPELPGMKLTQLCEYFGIVNERAHRAVSDAQAAYALYERLKMLPDVAAELFEPQKLFYRMKKREPMTDKQRSYLTAILNHHGLPNEYSMETMTKSEASRLIDELLRQYGRIPYCHE